MSRWNINCGQDQIGLMTQDKSYYSKWKMWPKWAFELATSHNKVCDKFDLKKKQLLELLAMPEYTEEDWLAFCKCCSWKGTFLQTSTVESPFGYKSQRCPICNEQVYEPTVLGRELDLFRRAKEILDE